ncbi:MAG: hypothetical protein R3F14_09040 [Polyangiaceae bacterium]
MNDGETTFWPGGPGNKSWNVAQGLESLYSERAIGPVIVVAIHAIDRNVEYSHTEWAPDTGVLRGGEICGLRGGRGEGVRGRELSHGAGGRGDSHRRLFARGLCAFVLANLRPDSFRMAGCLSPSFWLGLEPAWGGDYSGELATSKLLDMTKGTLSDPAQRPALWIDWGLVFTGGFHNEVIEKNAADYGQQMVDLLQSDYGYSVGQGLSWMEDPMGEHDEVSWARRFPLVMKAFYGVR